MAGVLGKMNYPAGADLLVVGAPASFEAELAAAAGARLLRGAARAKVVAFAILFVTRRDEVAPAWRSIESKLADDAIVWFAYPKGTSKRLTSDLSRDAGWEPVRAAGWDTVRLVAIDADWSALRFRRAALIGRRPGSGRGSRPAS